MSGVVVGGEGDQGRRYNNLGCPYSGAGDLDQALAAFLRATGTGQQRAREAVDECATARRCA